jgi:hypothetical protein
MPGGVPESENNPEYWISMWKNHENFRQNMMTISLFPDRREIEPLVVSFNRIVSG